MRRLGAIIAARLAEAGYDLALSSHSDGTPEANLALTLEKSATSWKHFAADLTDPQQAEGLVQSACDHFGRAPDLLVNNAAMFGQDDWSTMDAASLTAHFQLNLFSPLLLSRALVAAVDDGQPPAIVHILDQRIQNPNGDQLSYTLSKQALAQSVRTLAMAFSSRVRVNGVAPGLVIPTDDYNDAQMQRLASEMPLGHLPNPANVAEAVLYLAKAKDVTGQILFVDGGANLKSFSRDFMHL
jgi:pteridine reductase